MLLAQSKVQLCGAVLCFPGNGMMMGYTRKWLLNSLNISFSLSEDCQVITNLYINTYTLCMCVWEREEEGNVLFSVMSKAVLYCADEWKSEVITTLRHTDADTHTNKLVPFLGDLLNNCHSYFRHPSSCCSCSMLSLFITYVRKYSCADCILIIHIQYIYWVNNSQKQIMCGITFVWSMW